MWACGASFVGQLGLGATEEPAFPALTRVTGGMAGSAAGCPPADGGQVAAVSAGREHGLILTGGGDGGQQQHVLTFGANDLGQLGRPALSGFTRLERARIDGGGGARMVCAGWAHSLLVDGNGGLHACGANTHGQLGLGGGETEDAAAAAADEDGLFSLFMPVRFPTGAAGPETRVVRVAAGARHTLALSAAGQVWVWGDNSDGQLGLGPDIGGVQRPALVPGIAGLPVRDVAAGAHHSLLLTISGRVFACGHNGAGQLGLGSGGGGGGGGQATNRRRSHLERVASLKAFNVTSVACGEAHTLFLCAGWEGRRRMSRVFSCGNGMHGQLGHGQLANEPSPRLVDALAGEGAVKMVACGRRHSLVLTWEGRVLAFGANSSGQLGLGHLAPDCSLVPTALPTTCGMTIAYIAAGGDQTFCVEEASYSPPPVDPAVTSIPAQFVKAALAHPSLTCKRRRHRVSSSSSTDEDGGGPLNRSSSDSSSHTKRHKSPPSPPPEAAEPKGGGGSSLELVSLSSIPPIFSSESFTRATQLLGEVFSSPACLNSAFLRENHSLHTHITPTDSGLDLALVSALFDTVSELYNTQLNRTLLSAVEGLLGCGQQQLPRVPADVECLRLYLTLPQLHLMDNPLHWRTLILPFGAALLSLSPTALSVLGRWMAATQQTHFSKFLAVFKELIRHLLAEQPTHRTPAAAADPSVLRALMVSLRVLDFAWRINKSRAHPLPPNRFYIRELTKHLDLENDFVVWLRRRQEEKSQSTSVFEYRDIFSVVPVCHFPFALDLPAKARLLTFEAAIKMQMAVNRAMNKATTSAVMSLFTGAGPSMQECPFFILYIDRANIVDSALNQLISCDDSDLRKPLKVQFEGEEAVDAGGVRKEFFMLILKDILDPKYGMFRLVNDTRWFNDLIDPEQDTRLFQLIGIVCGLAMYNSTIVDLRFPLVLYKKLLSREVGLEDLACLEPDLARNLRHLLEYEGDDVEDTFCLNFQLTKDFYGQLQTVDLIPNGGSVAVSRCNREMFVSIYTDYLLNQSVSNQYSAFAAGFLKVAKGDTLHFFQPEELFGLVSGNQDYDFFQLENNTTYKEGYSADDPTIRLFWEVVHELSLEDKRKFLLFLTGSERVPVNGMKSLNFTIQPTGGGDQFLPAAHTCFNLLDLPRYSTKEVLRAKLLTAIENTEGFALV